VRESSYSVFEPHYYDAFPATTTTTTSTTTTTTTTTNDTSQIVHVLLLESKCNVNHHNCCGDTAICVAFERELHELVLLLVEYSATISLDVLFQCKQHNEVDTIAFLLEHGYDANAKDGKGTTSGVTVAGSPPCALPNLSHHNVFLGIVPGPTSHIQKQGWYGLLGQMTSHLLHKIDKFCV